MQHHQTNGRVERFIRYLENALGLVINRTQEDWDLLLDACLFAYQTRMLHRIREEPFLPPLWQRPRITWRFNFLALPEQLI